MRKRAKSHGGGLAKRPQRRRRRTLCTPHDSREDIFDEMLSWLFAQPHDYSNRLLMVIHVPQPRSVQIPEAFQ